MKRLFIIYIITLVSLSGYAVGVMEGEEVNLPERFNETEMVFVQIPQQHEIQNVSELKHAMRLSRRQEVGYIVIGSVCALAGTASVIYGINWISNHHCIGEHCFLKDLTFFSCVMGGTAVGLTSIPLYMVAHQNHKKCKRLKLQINTMTSRDVMGTVNVAPGVGMALNF